MNWSGSRCVILEAGDRVTLYRCLRCCFLDLIVQHVQLQAEDLSPLYSSAADISCSVDMMLPLTVITSPVQNKNAN